MKTKLLLSVFMLFICLSAYLSIQLLAPAISQDSQIEIEIPFGATYKQALTILEDEGLIKDKIIFLIIGKIYGLDRKIRAGFYLFKGRLNPWQAFKKLLKGEVIEYNLTINEGDSLLEIGKKLENLGLVRLERFLELSKDKQILDSFNINAPSLEGYLFPETYRVPKGATSEFVVRIMVNKLKKEYSGKLKEREKELGWTENQVLTLASIIEKEAVVDEERAIISGVYHNRIRLNMPLQADPTAIYGIKAHGSKITLQDLKNRTHYNTYIITGLPPGPIASPGIKSIVAALYPAQVPYLFFVSRKDGTHIFSRTLAEHNTAIRKVRSMPDDNE